MLERIIRIEGVGRLRRVCWPKLDSLKRFAGIYAENGTGKSTLAAVLRAARDGASLPLEDRRTLAANIPQRVELLINGKGRTFERGAWSGPTPKLDLYDTEFVETHVYIGRDFGADQRHQLYRLAIGAAEVEAAKRIEQANAVVADRTKDWRTAVVRVEERARSVGHSVDSFTALDKASPAEANRYVTTGAQLAALNAVRDLRALKTVGLLPPLPSLRVEGLQALLNESARSVAETSAGLVRDHLAHRLKPEGEGWLLQGSRYAAGATNCPYCAQTLDGSLLASAIAEFFDESYRALKSKIDLGRSRILQWQSWRSAALDVLLKNAAAATEWQRLLISLPSAPEVAPTVSTADEVAKILGELLAEKAGSPLSPMGKDARLDLLQPQLDALSAAITAYNQWSSTVAGECSNLVSTRQLTTATLESEALALKARVLRAEDIVAKEIDAVTQAAAHLERAKVDKAMRQAELEKLATGRATAFTTAVNEVLECFGAGFTVQDLQSKVSTSRVNSDFSIVLGGGGTVKASSKKDAEPRADTVLSDGDRRTLALAVFLSSTLKRDDLGDRIVVFDDPFASLDRNRRHWTCRYIQNLANVAAQVIVLSHDEFFLRDTLIGDVSQVELRNLDDGAEWLTWDAQEACKSRKLRELDRLRAVAAGRFPKNSLAEYDVQQAIRVVLEEHLKERHPSFFIGPKEWMGHFLQRAAEASTDSPVSPELLMRLNSWAGFSNPGHHSNPASPPPKPSIAELRTIADQVVHYVTA